MKITQNNNQNCSKNNAILFGTSLISKSLARTKWQRLFGINKPMSEYAQKSEEGFLLAKKELAQNKKKDFLLVETRKEIDEDQLTDIDCYYSINNSSFASPPDSSWRFAFPTKTVTIEDFKNYYINLYNTTKSAIIDKMGDF